MTPSGHDAARLTIRCVRDGDAQAIDAIVREAFTPDDRPVQLVAALRESPAHLDDLELVAELDDALVGHVVLSRTHVADAAGERHDVLTLSPLSVRTAQQGRGIGSALVLDALARADAAGETLVTVEGHPTYYPRFGFQGAELLGVVMALPDWAPREAAMARVRPGTTVAPRGRLVYPEAFDVVMED